MLIQPNFTVKTLADTEAGELVRLQWSGAALALVGTFRGERVVVCLDGPGTEEGPAFRIARANSKVISYGKNYILEVDQAPPFIDFSENSYYSVAGAIFIAPAQQFLYAYEASNSLGIGLVKYELKTGLVSLPQSTIDGLLFGKWRIWLSREPQAPSEEHTPIFSFSLKPTKGAR